MLPRRTQQGSLATPVRERKEGSSGIAAPRFEADV
jgi:hypothetical protein